ncbi:chromatin modification-related protein eaf-1-like [Amphibalanus amphitrite]|uniref:chromatin modification-related protein eaf-1-like n=1 Tax=Amphibalanus amphitrite TaxID=1232801 RepID=UPI001C919886|nr:chromatin modification-related protein eaf-1-like [Amphibalanus amphitrite]
MAAGRLCLLLLLVALAAARAAAEPMGVGVRVSPPRPRERDLVIEEGSGDGDEVEEDGEADVTVLKPATKKQTKQSLTGSKILDGVVPSTAQSFFNYGMGFALLTYITMGISYFYGPYSASAFLANKRANQRMKYLEHQMKDEEEESEYDYGNYAQEEVNSILEHGGYYGGYDQHGGGFGQDSYVSYEGQVSHPGRVARRRGVAARSGSYRQQQRRVKYDDPAERPQRRRQQPWRRQAPAQRQETAAGGGGVFRVAPRRPAGYPAQRPAPTRTVLPAGQQQQRRRQTVGQGGARPAPRPSQQQVRPSRPVLTHQQRQRQPGYRPAPVQAQRTATSNAQRTPTSGLQVIPGPAQTGTPRQPQPQSRPQPQPQPQPQFRPQPQPSTSASQEARPSVQSAGSQSAEENKAAATSQAQERHPVSSGKDGESSVDMVELIAGVDTSHPDCRAWIRCLQNARHPDIPLGVRRGRVDVDNSDCRQFAASCPSKKP